MTASKIVAAAASGVGGAGLDVNEVFSTFVYDGNHVGNSIENGINLGNDTEERVLLNLSGDALTDTGPNTLTVSNNSVAVNTSTKKYGTGSLRFNGSATATVTDASLTLGTSDFTIEFWLYLDSLSLKGILNIGNPSDHTDYSIGMYVDANGGITSQYRNTPNNMGAFSTGTATTNMSATTWHHVAIVRHNDTLSAYLDGSVIGTDDISGTTVGWNQLELGTHWGTSGGDDYRFTGYIDDFRLSKKAVYTANFTAPSSAHSTSYTATTGEGGLVWSKVRSNGFSNALIDTERGVNYYLKSNDTTAQDTSRTDLITSFNSNGYTLGSDGGKWYWNRSGEEYVSWTFRKAPKFFDVVTWTGDGTASRNISHNLKSVPGHVMVKKTSGGSAAGWINWHRTFSDYQSVFLNTTEAVYNPGNINSGVFGLASGFTSTQFQLGGTTNITYHNENNSTYVAYVFAHNNSDGGFGPTGSDDIIKCGSYTGNGSSTGPVVDLGFEPQWVMIKRASAAEDWIMFDNMRGLVVGGIDPDIRPNKSQAEGAFVTYMDINATGFQLTDNNSRTNENNDTYIYMAIRRGPLAAPEDATKVFNVNTYSNNGNSNIYNTGFDVDMSLSTNRDGANNFTMTRLTGNDHLKTDTNAAAVTESSGSVKWWDSRSNYLDLQTNWWGTNNAVSWAWKRAPSYFDVVAYQGSGSMGLTLNHNLGVVPEMIWVKNRSANNDDWFVYHSALGNTKWLELNQTTAEQTHQAAWNNTSPTATQFTVGAYNGVNGSSGYHYIAYLFATVAGVSKVGSYTGNGTGQNIECGFSSGARFILIKRTSGADSWFVWDSVRGIVSGNDPYLRLNLTTAETTTTDRVDPYSGGFAVTGSDDGNNKNGNTYIFYAIA